MCPRTLPGPKERPEARKDQNAGTEWRQSGLGTHQWAAYPPTRSLELRLRGRRWGHLASEQPTTDLERRLLDLMGAQEPNGETRGIEKGLRMPAGKVFFGTPFASPALIRLSASPGGGDSAGPIRARQIGREIDATLPGLSVCTQARRGLLGTDYVCSPSLIPGGSGNLDLGRQAARWPDRGPPPRTTHVNALHSGLRACGAEADGRTVFDVVPTGRSRAELPCLSRNYPQRTRHFRVVDTYLMQCSDSSGRRAGIPSV